MSAIDGVIAWPRAAEAATAAAINVRAARCALGMSQTAFARFCRFSVSDLRRWERGTPIACPTTRVLLTLIARDPEAVRRAFDLR